MTIVVLPWQHLSEKPLPNKVISIVSKEVAKIPDYRQMVGLDSVLLHRHHERLAVMHLKKPSLLQFAPDCVKCPDVACVT